MFVYLNIKTQHVEYCGGNIDTAEVMTLDTETAEVLTSRQVYSP